MKRVASIVVRAGDLVLFGKRKDTGLWTLPSGHANDGESIAEAAVRELLEETGLRVAVEDLRPIGVREVKSRGGDWMQVFGFELKLEEVRILGVGGSDPDEEVSEWAWFEDLPELQNVNMKLWI